jgi:hypothetical protein
MQNKISFSLYHSAVQLGSELRTAASNVALHVTGTAGKAAVAVVRQSICKTLSNILHLNHYYENV